MKNKKENKKSLAMMDALVWGGIMIVTVLVLAFIIPNLLGKGGAEASNLLSSTKDYDRDGVADYFDKCACELGDERNEGCPLVEPLEGEVAVKREKECKKEIKGA